jgi:N-acetyltransferase
MDIKTVTLEGTHARLMPLEMAHHGPLAALLEPNLLQWFPARVESADDLRGFMQDWQNARDAGTALPFVTIDRATGAPVGSTSFMNIDRTNRRAEIGATWLGRKWQRSAINTEAKLLMLTHAFETWNCIRVELKTDSLNTVSRAAITRLGAVEEGCFRNHMITDSGRIRHTVWFSITPDDWPRVKRGLQDRLTRG